MIYFSCTSCKRIIHAADERAGKKMPCPGCGQPLVIPPAARGLNKSPDRLLPDSSSVPEELPVEGSADVQHQQRALVIPEWESPGRSRKALLFVISLAIVMGLCLTALLIVVLKMRDGERVGSSEPAAQTLQFLSDMNEFDVRVTEGRFGKKGFLGYEAGFPPKGKIVVRGNESPNGLSMVPDSDTYAAAKYNLAGKAKRFIASVALNDSAGAAGQLPGVGKIPTALTFIVIGDDKVLWKSQPVDSARSVQNCNVDVSGVIILELRVDCPGSGVNAQAVWLEPRLLLK